MASLLGLPCPTCGMTRAVRSLLRGDAAGATSMHPLVWVVVPVLGVAVALELATYVKTGRWGRVTGHRAWRVVLVVLAVMLVVVWLARFRGAFGGPVPT